MEPWITVSYYNHHARYNPLSYYKVMWWSKGYVACYEGRNEKQRTAIH